MTTHTIIVSNEIGKMVTTRPVALPSNAAAHRVAKSRSADLGGLYLVEVFDSNDEILGRYRNGM